MRQITFRLLSFRDFVRGLDKRKRASWPHYIRDYRRRRVCRLLVCDACRHGCSIARYGHWYLVRGISHAGA